MFIRLEPTPENDLKTNLKKKKHSEIKTLVTKYFLDKYAK